MLTKKHFTMIAEGINKLSTYIRNKYKQENNELDYVWEMFWAACDCDFIDSLTLHRFYSRNQIETALKIILLEGGQDEHKIVLP